MMPFDGIIMGIREADGPHAFSAFLSFGISSVVVSSGARFALCSSELTDAAVSVRLVW